MEILALVPGLLSAAVAFGRSPQKAFLNVYLPVLVLLPEYYRLTLPGIPKVAFSQAAILPVVAAMLLRRSYRWRFTVGDVLVFGIAICIGYSEYRNAGYKEAQNLTFDMLAWAVLPYVLGKGLIEPNGLRVPFARRFTFLLFIVAVASVYEFKFGVVPYKSLLDRLFPWQAEGWVTTFRYGFARVAGPYGHAILAGIIFVVGYRMHRWLEWSGCWEPEFQKMRWLPVSKGAAIRLGLLAGIVMTFARGPWIGALLAAGATAVGRARNRKQGLTVAIALVVLIGIPGMVYMFRYASVGREKAATVSQESAAYRKELIDKYVEIALQRSVWGWGRNTWPKVPGMPSIDNYYLFLALMHGLVAVCFLLAILFGTAGRLFLHAMSMPPPAPRGSSLGFTLIGIYLAIAFSLATVYMGTQVLPIFFLITGWAEGYLLAGKESFPAESGAAAPRTFHFRRVLT